MRYLNLTSFFRISLLALVMMLSAGPVSAQTNGYTRPTTTTIDRDNNTVRTERDTETDWGWIGLLGLVGLAGLLPKKRTIEHDRDDTGNRTLNR